MGQLEEASSHSDPTVHNVMSCQVFPQSRVNLMRLDAVLHMATMSRFPYLSLILILKNVNASDTSVTSNTICLPLDVNLHLPQTRFRLTKLADTISGRTS
jgi:hypothetical protein